MNSRNAKLLAQFLDFSTLIFLFFSTGVFLLFCLPDFQVLIAFVGTQSHDSLPLHDWTSLNIQCYHQSVPNFSVWLVIFTTTYPTFKIHRECGEYRISEVEGRDHLNLQVNSLCAEVNAIFSEHSVPQISGSADGG